MFEDNKIDDPAKIGDESDAAGDAASDGFTAQALTALAELEAHDRDRVALLEAHDSDHVELLLLFGEAVSKAKASLKHGEFDPWCTEVLKKSPSWVSLRRRLFENRADLEPARAWAASTGHRWASCHSAERLFAVIGDYKKATRVGTATTTRARPKAEPETLTLKLKRAKRRIAELHRYLREAAAEFNALRDPLPPEDKARAAKLAAELAFAYDAAKEDELKKLALKYHWRVRDLAGESCSALQVSGPGMTGVDESTSDEGSAS